MPIETGGKTVFMEFEVEDATLEYNLLLKNTWFYAMKVII